MDSLRYNSPSSGPALKMRAAVFTARCAGSAAVAFELASGLGLAEASWAAISAVVVSQDELHDTRSTLVGRIMGTSVGIAVTLVTHLASAGLIGSVALQMTISVAVCALIARRYPPLRVAMWTCPILLLPAEPAVSMTTLAVRRGAEVILGALVAWVCHWAADQLTALAAAGRRNSVVSRVFGQKRETAV